MRSTAAQIRTQWHSYVAAFQAFNRDWNVQQQLAKPQIDAAEASRKQLLAELEHLNEQLIRRMAGEASAARDNVSACPP